MRAGESVTRIGLPPSTTPAGSSMLPVPHTTLASVLKSQTATAPAKMTFE
jgi:hypothetical protein